MPEKSKKKSKVSKKKVSDSVKSKKALVPEQSLISLEEEGQHSVKLDVKKNKVSAKFIEDSNAISSAVPQPPLEQKFVIAPTLEGDSEFDSNSISAKFRHNHSKAPEQLTVSLSHSLIRKLKEQAVDEGISLEEFVTELLSEGVVLRAWEIVERKNQMKGVNSGVGHSNGNHHRNNLPNGNQHGNSMRNQNQNQNQRSGNKSNRAMNHMRYQAIMDDKASFLEYVRNQERSRR